LWLLALPAHAGAAAPQWTYSLFGLSQNPGSYAQLDVLNASGHTATITAGIGLQVKPSKTVAAGNSVSIQTHCLAHLGVGQTARWSRLRRIFRSR
jgi:hypothetical protein